MKIRCLSYSWLACLVGLCAFALIGCAVGRTAQSPPGITNAIKDQIDTIARGALAHQHLASLSLAIARNGDIIYARAYGYRNVAKRLPATTETVYNIASMSKQFTATCVMLLQQDGKLNVDDPLVKYLPEFSNLRGVRLRNLLNHSSGIPDYLDLVDNNNLSPSKVAAALKKATLQYAPGSKYQYSNSNYILSGLVVQRVSGMPFDDFLRRRIFAPLQLHSTSIGTAPKDMADGAAGYTVADYRLTPAAPQSVLQLDFPDGGVNSTAVDLARWDMALDSGSVVNEQLVSMMFTPGPHGKETTHGYGLGLGVDTFDGRREISHQGEWTGYAGENVTFPDERFAVVLLSNTDGFNEDLLARRLFALFFPLAPGRQVYNSDAASLENRAYTTAARSWLAQLTSGSVDRTRMTTDLSTATSGRSLAALRKELASYGTLQRIAFIGRDSDSSGVTEQYRLFYPAAVVSYTFRLGRSGKIETFGLNRED